MTPHISALRYFPAKFLVELLFEPHLTILQFHNECISVSVLVALFSKRGTKCQNVLENAIAGT